MTNTRSHKSTVTQPRLIQTTLEDALLSGQHVDVSIAPYNIHFLSLSDSSEQRAQHQRKLANVQHLVQKHTMTAILETHVTGAKAELFFCRYVESTHRFFIHGMAVLVQEAWADHFNPVLSC